MEKHKVTILPPLALIYENGKYRKYRVGGYMKVVFMGCPALMDRSPLYNFFEDVVSHYPNWELTDVFEDVTDERAELITFHGIISALQAAKEKKIDILLIKSHKDLLGITTDTSRLLQRMLFNIGVDTLFIEENLHYSSPFDFSYCNELPFE